MRLRATLRFLRLRMNEVAAESENSEDFEDE
jgi:hypothetical protein